MTTAPDGALVGSSQAGRPAPSVWRAAQPPSDGRAKGTKTVPGQKGNPDPTQQRREPRGGKRSRGKAGHTDGNQIASDRAQNRQQAKTCSRRKP